MSVQKEYIWQCAREDIPMNKVIEISNLNFTYPDGTRALEEINLDVYENETLGIIGPNGAGKSTLLLHLNGLLNGNGKVKIFGKAVSKENITLIRQKVGLVFQDPQDQLFMPTVYEDVAFGPNNLGIPKQEIDRKVSSALEEVGLLDKRDNLSYHMSLGEQKRLSIATVLSMSPEILVLDEPNSNLDPASRRHLINLLKRLKVTKVLATHDLEMVLELCSKVVLLDKGKVIDEGETKEILSDKLLLEPHGLEIPLSLLLNR
jgi:cobalt/nickel transport system ATP-binding protein